MANDWNWGVACTEFLTIWRRRPAALEGSIALYNLAFLARAGAARPLFPEALEALLSQQKSDGAFGRDSGLALCDFVVGLTVANTLIARRGEASAIRGAINQALKAVTAMGQPPRLEAPQHYGPRFTFGELPGYWIVPVYEVERLLETGTDYLSPQERAAIAATIEAHRGGTGRRWLDQLDHAWYFEANLMIIHCGEVFPEATFQSRAVRDHAALTHGLPGHTVPVAARFVEATGDPVSTARLRALLSRPLDGLWPTFGLPEQILALWFLTRGGVDLRQHCAIELARFARRISVAPGLPVMEGASGNDCDSSAVALYVAHLTGVKAGFTIELLEKSWVAESDCYWGGFEDRPIPSVSTEIHVLDAIMTAPDASLDDKRRIWRRTVRLLESRPWCEQFHLSPFYIWELIAGMGFRYASLFPETETNVHHVALNLILDHQDRNGGFRSAYVPRVNMEETGFALLALRAAQSALPPDCDLAKRLVSAISAARTFLMEEWPRRHLERTELWVGKLLSTPPNLIDSIVLASLA
jgi:hypothetical protein